jgi:hypothetical protein
MSFSSMMWIPGYAIYYLATSTGSIHDVRIFLAYLAQPEELLAIGICDFDVWHNILKGL